MVIQFYFQVLSINWMDVDQFKVLLLVTLTFNRTELTGGSVSSVDGLENRNMSSTNNQCSILWKVTLYNANLFHQVRTSIPIPFIAKWRLKLISQKVSFQSIPGTWPKPELGI